MPRPGPGSESAKQAVSKCPGCGQPIEVFGSNHDSSSKVQLIILTWMPVYTNYTRLTCITGSAIHNMCLAIAVVHYPHYHKLVAAVDAFDDACHIYTLLSVVDVVLV
jgi:hypothetical protein